MTVSSAARKTPSIGLPSQANRPISDAARRAPSRAPRRRRTSSGSGREVEPAARRSATPSAISALFRSSSPRLGPISSSRSLVTSPPRPRASACRISASSSLVELAGADGDVRRRRSPARRPAGSRRRSPPSRASSTDSGWVAEYSTSRPPVNSTPRSSPRTPMPERRPARPARRAPASAAAAHQVGVLARSASARTRPMLGDAADAAGGCMTTLPAHGPARRAPA